jgi:CBS domain-containing protein
LLTWGDALKNPLAKLLGSFSRKDGEHKDEFDIKGRGLMPLIDAQDCCVCIKKNYRVNNTF